MEPFGSKGTSKARGTKKGRVGLLGACPGSKTRPKKGRVGGTRGTAVKFSDGDEVGNGDEQGTGQGTGRGQGMRREGGKVGGKGRKGGGSKARAHGPCRVGLGSDRNRSRVWPSPATVNAEAGTEPTNLDHSAAWSGRSSRPCASRRNKLRLPTDSEAGTEAKPTNLDCSAARPARSSRSCCLGIIKNKAENILKIQKKSGKIRKNQEKIRKNQKN
ncbi:hypothetical protein BDN72DRAFT_865876 [Pluteus cervinus]|uniref:Uncharacterized protein n=1 Tax=Pluteus cervinus TaxID=181527 RepID=A0ACD2ZZJ6_9AGAR|nr:hypothetical protein BDN72DRAFT_865876 [Pluteus cervinus]